MAGVCPRAKSARPRQSEANKTNDTLRCRFDAFMAGSGSRQHDLLDAERHRLGRLGNREKKHQLGVSGEWGQEPDSSSIAARSEAAHADRGAIGFLYLVGSQ